MIASRRGNGFARRELDGAARQADQRVVVAEFDDAETRVLSAAIDSQHAHGGSLSQQFSCRATCLGHLTVLMQEPSALALAAARGELRRGEPSCARLSQRSARTLISSK